jgi:hypothetical protein
MLYSAYYVIVKLLRNQDVGLSEYVIHETVNGNFLIIIDYLIFKKAVLYLPFVYDDHKLLLQRDHCKNL